jgi:hypothetical protein
MCIDLSSTFATFFSCFALTYLLNLYQVYQSNTAFNHYKHLIFSSIQVSFFGIFSLVYADPFPGLKRVWRIRYTSQPVRMTGRVGGGGVSDGWRGG